jgi:hypothetical protein
VHKPGKTRGAIGFALIFLFFVSLYQDKEMKKKDIYFIGAVCSGYLWMIGTFGVWRWSLTFVKDLLIVRGFEVTFRVPVTKSKSNLD